MKNYSHQNILVSWETLPGLWLFYLLTAYSNFSKHRNPLNKNKRHVHSNESISLLTPQYIAFTHVSLVHSLKWPSENTGRQSQGTENLEKQWRTWLWMDFTHRSTEPSILTPTHLQHFANLDFIIVQTQILLDWQLMVSWGANYSNSLQYYSVLLSPELSLRKNFGNGIFWCNYFVFFKNIKSGFFCSCDMHSHLSWLR